MSGPLTLRIGRVLKATPRSRIVRLDLDGTRFPYRSGQSVRVGAHGSALKKPYSIASAPEETHDTNQLELLIGVDAAGSPGPHLPNLRRGGRLDVEGPLGSFFFPDHPTEQNFLFIGGGTGIAPLRSMIWHALLAACPGRLGVLYSARSPREFAYVTELQRLARQGRIRLTLTATREADASWRGERGRINLRRLEHYVGEKATLCFICGPPSLIDEVRPLLEQLGVAPSRIRTEEW